MKLGPLANRILIRRGLEIREIQRPVFLKCVHDGLTTAEASLGPQSTRNDALATLRRLGLTDFGIALLSMPNPEFPKVSSLLPRMADPEVQKSWTGASGVELLTLTVDFVRSIAYNFAQITGRPLRDAKILDFGCGYGRITRLMYYFIDEEGVYAVDPWDKSIEICHADGLTKNFLLSEYLPSTLPVPLDFDLIFAFSVFTHLSERATMTCLNTLANYVKDDGVIAITIRPVEYWDVDINAGVLGARHQQKELHGLHGFSFLPHEKPGPSGGGDITYGDTSMSVEWLETKFPNLKVVGLDRSLADPYQLYVFLQKK